MTINALGLRSPSNIVLACALNVLPQVLQRYRARFFPWLTILPCPTFPLAMQSRFGQNTCEASICSVFGLFIVTAYRSMLVFSTHPDFSPPIRGVLPHQRERNLLFFAGVRACLI